jgi:hypothetical protein
VVSVVVVLSFQFQVVWWRWRWMVKVCPARVKGPRVGLVRLVVGVLGWM